MLNLLKEVLLGGASAEIAEAPRTERIALATCVILVEAAGIDDDFTLEERTHILQVLKQRFELAEEDAKELLQQAIATRKGSTDLFRFTTVINQEFSKEEKMEVLEEVWRIFYSDGTLDGHEDHLAHKLRNLLNLNHPQMIETKMRVLSEIRGKQ